MKLALCIVAALALVVVAVVAVGAALPKAHVARRRARFQAPPARVFGVVSDFAALPGWRASVTKVELLPGQRFRESGKDGSVAYKVEALEQDKLLRTRIDERLPFGGTWTWSLEPDGAGCVLTIVEQGEVYNPIFRFVSRFIIGHTATIDGYLKDLAAKLGEPLQLR